MLKITGAAAIGDLRSKLHMDDDRAFSVLEVPLDVEAKGQAKEILEALHVGDLFGALFDVRGAVRMPYFSHQAVEYPLRNLRMEIGLGGSAERLVVPSLDLHKVRWNVLPGYGVHLTCKAKATVTSEQLVGLWKLQPYTGLGVTLIDNQSALSLEAA